MEFETERAIGGILRDEAVAITCLRAPAPAYDEALIAKVKKSTACLGEIGWATLNQVFFAGYGNGVSVFLNLQTECTRESWLAGIAIVEHGDIVAIRLLVVTGIMLAGKAFIE